MVAGVLHGTCREAGRCHGEGKMAYIWPRNFRRGNGSITQRTTAGLALTLPKIQEKVRLHGRIVTAILIRDMRTRFGRTQFTYLVAIGWPLSHVSIMVIAFTFANRLIPFGTDSVVFITTGALPYVLCLYPARTMALMTTHTGTTLQFPIVHPLHLILARMLLEGLSAFFVALVLVSALWCLGTEIMPRDLPAALLAVYASVFFGLSIGLLGMVLRAILKMAGYLIIVLTMIVMYFSSGVYMNVMPTSEMMRTLLGFNPIYQLVSWMRSAYFETHAAVPLDRAYVLFLSILLLFVGFLGERAFRGKFLTS